VDAARRWRLELLRRGAGDGLDDDGGIDGAVHYAGLPACAGAGGPASSGADERGTRDRSGDAVDGSQLLRGDEPGTGYGFLLLPVRRGTGGTGERVQVLRRQGLVPRRGGGADSPIV